MAHHCLAEAHRVYPAVHCLAEACRVYPVVIVSVSCGDSGIC